MTNRIMLALGVALLVVGPSFAQESAEEASPAPQVVGEGPAVTGEAIYDEPLPGCDAGPGYWLTADGLIGWIQRVNLPPLVTSSPPGTSQANAGVLGVPTTNAAFGGSVNEDARGGFHLGTGWWLSCDHCLGIEAGFTMLESQSTLYSASSFGTPILARPFFNALTNKQDAQLIAFPGTSTGAVGVQASSGNFYEGHLDFLGNVVDRSGWRVDALVGYRFYRYDEGLRITQSVSPTGSTFVPGTVIVAADSFTAENTFNGGEAGLKAQFDWHDLTFGVLAKAAVGNLQRVVNIQGNTTTSVPGVTPTTSPGGLYALSSNIGIHNSGDWTWMPELGGTLSWKVTGHMKLNAGYSLLFLDQVARAASQVDMNVNTDLLPPAKATAGPNVPAYQLERNDVWIQTFSFGVEFSF